MKLFNVVLDDGRNEEVVADDYQLIDGEYKFFHNGQPISEVFFRESSVVGVNVKEDNYVSPSEKWERWARAHQMPEPTYGVDDDLDRYHP
jgi:hypothetical protein